MIQLKYCGIKTPKIKSNQNLNFILSFYSNLSWIAFFVSPSFTSTWVHPLFFCGGSMLLISVLVFFNVFFALFVFVSCVPNVACFSGLFILDSYRCFKCFVLKYRCGITIKVSMLPVSILFVFFLCLQPNVACVYFVCVLPVSLAQCCLCLQIVNVACVSRLSIHDSYRRCLKC